MRPSWKHHIIQDFLFEKANWNLYVLDGYKEKKVGILRPDGLMNCFEPFSIQIALRAPRGWREKDPAVLCTCMCCEEGQKSSTQVSRVLRIRDKTGGREWWLEKQSDYLTERGYVTPPSTVMSTVLSTRWCKWKTNSLARFTDHSICLGTSQWNFPNNFRTKNLAWIGIFVLLSPTLTRLPSPLFSTLD